jgi:hypothetical protein
MIFLGNAVRRPVPVAASKAWCGNMNIASASLRTKRQYKHHQNL